MSLVILTNDASESVIAGQESSIFKPFSFRNSLTSTIEIPVQAQIALQSAKLVMDGSLQVGESNGVFYLYLGQFIDPDGAANQPRQISQIGYAPIRLQLFPTNTATQSVTAEELGNELERVLNETSGRGIFHPSYVGAEQKVSIKTDAATGAFEGYNIDLKYIAGRVEAVASSAAAAVVVAGSYLDATSFRRRPPTLAGNLPLGPADQLAATAVAARNAQPYTIDSLAVGGGAFAVRMTAGSPGVPDFTSQTFGCTFDSAPISPFGGECEFDIRECTLQNTGAGRVDNRTCAFVCGLSRVSTTSTDSTASRPAPPNFRFQAGSSIVTLPAGPTQGSLLAWIRHYFDFAVCVDRGGTLRVIQCSQDQNVPIGPNGGTRANNSARTHFLDYTQGGTAAPPFNTNYVFSDMSGFTFNTGAGNASNFIGVHFKVEGEIVTIQMRNAGGLVPLITFNAGNAVNLKPAQQNCWNLQPIMLMNLERQRPGGLQASGRNIGDYTMRLVQYEIVPDAGGAATNIQVNRPSQAPSYYNTLLKEMGGISPLYNRLEDCATLPTGIAYTGINGGAGLFVGNRPVLLVAEDGVYTPSQGANSRELLGFQGFPAALQTQPPWVADAFDGTRTTVQRLASGVIPSGVSTKSLFIRIDNLTQETINAGNGNMSRIISHLPITDNLEDAGYNFYEPNSLTYLDLKNAEPLKLNFLDASVVYADEHICRSLVGSSVIVLHIREKPK